MSFRNHPHNFTTKLSVLAVAVVSATVCESPPLSSAVLHAVTLFLYLQPSRCHAPSCYCLVLWNKPQEAPLNLTKPTPTTNLENGRRINHFMPRIGTGYLDGNVKIPFLTTVTISSRRYLTPPLSQHHSHYLPIIGRPNTNTTILEETGSISVGRSWQSGWRQDFVDNCREHHRSIRS